MQIQEGLTKATAAIRGLEPLSCDDIEVLLTVIAARMKTADGAPEGEVIFLQP